MTLTDLLRMTQELGASDLFLKEGAPAEFRVNGRIQSMEGGAPLTAQEVEALLMPRLSERQRRHYEDHHEIDLGFTEPGIARFRGNFYQQRGSMSAVLRRIPLEMPHLEDLGMPPVLSELPKYRQGLILITGPTGSGKSTTLAAMINQINEGRPCNIVTIEDPIEFVHQDKKAIVSQREVGIDTASFQSALRVVVRQSPDVILIGEMRDPETMTVALQASETGHLVFSTVHTPSASETMDRIVNMFPPHEKQQIALRMSNSLRGIVSQKLVPKADGAGRLPGVEVMINTPTVAKLIEEARFSQVYGAIQEGSYWGMQTMNQCLLRYYKSGLITEEDALAYAGNITELRQLIRRP
ncbi:MAG: type IV pili twitching motility protein PilT [Chloroflexota bacterium]